MILKRIITTLMLTITVAGMTVTGSFAAVNDDVARPTIDAKSAILYSVTTDEILYSKNADTKVEPWSTTKLMTALLVVENMDMDQMVTVTAKAASQGGSTMNLVAGERLSVRNLLYGLLMESGNDAAYALGTACGNGNVKTFVKMMNDRAKKLGCTNTHFMNPNGLKAKNHYTTASDFLKIAKAALSNKTVYKISGTKVYHVGKTNKSSARTIETHLDLLETKNSGVVAGKTGYWAEDDCSIALMYSKKGLQMILVQFGANMETRAKDDAKLLKYGTKKIVTLKATDSKESLGKARVRYGARTRVDAYAKDVVNVYPKDGTDKTVKVKTHYTKGIQAPLQAGDKVGTADVYCDGKKVATTEVIVKEDVEKGWILSAVYISNRETVLLGAVTALLILVLWLRHRVKGKMNK